MPDPTPHRPTEDTRRQVSAMVAFGIPQDKIAVIVGISAPTLRKHYRAEIDIADAKAQSMVAKFLFSTATGEALRTGATHADCIRSAMFWLKTRAGWRETSAHEITGRDGMDLVPPTSDFETARRVAFLLARAQHHLDSDPASADPVVITGEVRLMPPKFIELTDDQRAEVETLAALLNQDQIADYLGISRSTFIAIRERDLDIEQRYKRGKAKAIAHVARGLLMKARNGDTVSSIFYLKTQAGWRETDRLEHAGGLTINVIDKYDDNPA